MALPPRPDVTLNYMNIGPVVAPGQYYAPLTRLPLMADLHDHSALEARRLLPQHPRRLPLSQAACASSVAPRSKSISCRPEARSSSRLTAATTSSAWASEMTPLA